MSSPAEKLAEVRERIAEAARKSGRVPDAVRLIAVSKTKPVEAIEALADLGQRDFGENQMQEALEKIERLRGRGLEWHFIGHLQSNKTRFIGGHFSWVHSVDSERLAGRIAAAVRDGEPAVRLLVQVNVFRDPAKHGVASEELFALLDAILARDLPGIRLCGLMTIGRLGGSEADTRRGFARARRLLEDCRQRFGEGFKELSMGMSGDYPLAIEEGATMVRVGTALFGSR
ncbi:MAG: YggS family pyridoxal phosphate-dependent enzyme [Gammaproteobacteria bacterium]|nr:MAG: YggS family pyridoxal phosphate-dependent enzyme [Gammaproteobacteria bacterium]